MHRATPHPPTASSYHERRPNVEPLTRPKHRPRGEGLEPAEIGMILGSLGLLLLTCVETSPIRELAVIGWLVSLALIGVRNIGAALGIYIGAVALYSNQFFKGNFSVFERPDHPALLILLIQVGLLRMKGERGFSIDGLTLALGSFLAYGVVNGLLTNTFSNATLAGLARVYGIPFLLTILILRARPQIKDVWSFFLVLFVVAGYDVIVSILWAAGLDQLMFPAWLTDPSFGFYRPGSRAGGILLRYGSNAKFLSLILCLVCLVYRTWAKDYARPLLIILGAGILIGIFVTYSRAAYLGTIPPLLMIFWQGASSGKRTALKRLFVVSAASIGILATLLAPPTKLEERVTNEDTIHWRFEIWKIGLRMIPDRPVFGFGVQGYGVNAASFYEDSEILNQRILEKGKPTVHNIFLNLLIEFGLVGFLLYSTALYLLFRRGVHHSRLVWGSDGVVWILVFLGVYLIVGQFALVTNPAVNLIFYCTPALLVGLGWRTGLPKTTNRGTRVTRPLTGTVVAR